MALPGAVTLQSLIDACKSQTDNVNEEFILDSEWIQYINTGYLELYGMIVQAFGNDYFTQGLTPYTFTTNGTDYLFPLPDGTGPFPAFFKLLGIDLQLYSPGQWITLRPFNFNDRNVNAWSNTQIPLAGQIFRVFYVPLAIPLSDPADVVEGVNGWEDWIVCKACMMALAKEESDPSIFMARISMLKDRLASEIENRDAGASATVVDIYGRSAVGMRYRLNGNSIWLQGTSTPGYWPMGDWGQDGSW